MRWGRSRLDRARAWRDGIRARPNSYRIYRLIVGGVGGVVALGGLFLVPLPGPGWLIVLVGLAILASEFTWAEKVLYVVRTYVRAWTQWIGEQSVLVRTAIGLATAAFVGAVLWGVFAVLGVPGWVPDAIVPPLPGLKP